MVDSPTDCTNYNTCVYENGIAETIDNNLQNHKDKNIHKYEYGKNYEHWDYSCFVIMPYGSKNEYQRGYIESNFIFNYIICPAIDKFENEVGKKVKVFREIENPISGSITRSMIEHIAGAEICIVDITGQNPNVFFELGIRYSLMKKTTILLKQKNTEVPFDLNGYRCITYDSFEPSKAVIDLSHFLISSYRGYVNNDSLVFETFPDMKVDIHGLLTSKNEMNIDLSWNEWWGSVKKLIDLLQDPIKNGRFSPNVIFGISNGGLLVADLLRQKIHTPAPVLSLWADRHNKSNFFDNVYNRALMGTLKKEYAKKKISILLVDDLVYSGATVKQASDFINQQFDDNCSILFTPLYCREQSIEELKLLEYMLPYGFKNEFEKHIFEISSQKYFEQVHTEKQQFPYGKALNHNKF